MHVLGIRRSQCGQPYRDDTVDEMLPASDLYILLERSDFVVLTLPLMKESRHDEAAPRHMKPTGYLINVSRGGIIDERALTRPLETNAIAGAGLDVFSREPLPSESRLWDLPNVVITPHWAGIVGGDVRCVCWRGYSVRTCDATLMGWN